MSTAYQPQLVVTLDNHHGGLHYPSTIAYANKAKFSRAEHATSQAPRQVPQSSLSQVPVNWQRRDATFTPAAQANPKSRQPTGPSTPLQETTISVPPSKAAAPRPSETLVYHSLQIPSCITPEGGNLADFAAQVRQAPSETVICSANLPDLDDLFVLVPIRQRPQTGGDVRLGIRWCTNRTTAESCQTG